jgi:hypothetical protein
MEQYARVRELDRQQRANTKLDEQFSDTPDPIMLVQKGAGEAEVGEAGLGGTVLRDEFTGKDRHTLRDSALDNYRAELVNRSSRAAVASPTGEVVTAAALQGQRFGDSKSRFQGELEDQHQVIGLFRAGSAAAGPALERMRGNYDLKQAIHLTDKDERPSQKDIELYRGDRDVELTSADRALQQAESYMNKYLDYMALIRGMRKLEQIPGQAERRLMLENFYKYLVDARYYIKFYHKYSGFWAPEATKTIEVRLRLLLTLRCCDADIADFVHALRKQKNSNTRDSTSPSIRGARTRRITTRSRSASSPPCAA